MSSWARRMVLKLFDDKCHRVYCDLYLLYSKKWKNSFFRLDCKLDKIVGDKTAIYDTRNV